MELIVAQVTVKLAVKALHGVLEVRVNIQEAVSTVELTEGSQSIRVLREARVVNISWLKSCETTVPFTLTARLSPGFIENGRVRVSTCATQTALTCTEVAFDELDITTLSIVKETQAVLASSTSHRLHDRVALTVVPELIAEAREFIVVRESVS